MATLTKGQTFGSTEQVTNTKLHNLIDSGTISDIVNADVNASAAISETKISFDGSTVVTLSDTQTIDGVKTFTGNNTFAGTTIADLGAVTTADINAGTVDATIGGTTPAAGTFTTLAVAGTGDDGVIATGIKDEDDMASDSATHLATQQSIKAYITSNASASETFTGNGTFTAPAGVNLVYVDRKSVV